MAIDFYVAVVYNTSIATEYAHFGYHIMLIMWYFLFFPPVFPILPALFCAFLSTVWTMLTPTPVIGDVPNRVTPNGVTMIARPSGSNRVRALHAELAVGLADLENQMHPLYFASVFFSG